LGQRGVAVNSGLRDEAGVLRRLSELSARLEGEGKLRMVYEWLRKEGGHNH